MEYEVCAVSDDVNECNGICCFCKHGNKNNETFEYLSDDLLQSEVDSERFSL